MMIPLLPSFSPQIASIMGATMPPLRGNGSGEGNVSMEQVLALLTATTLQMERMLADAMKTM